MNSRPDLDAIERDLQPDARFDVQGLPIIATDPDAFLALVRYTRRIEAALADIATGWHGPGLAAAVARNALGGNAP